MSSDTPSVEPPYLSVIVATRNDDHGGDPLKRLQAFINTFAAQCRRRSLDAEVIVVEWNPPPDRPRVSESCRVPPDAPFPVRFVEVPAQLHHELRFASVLPLFQMIAKNVGIRRARGRFILATNIDIIFSDELVEHLASGCLAPDHLYRVDRHDIESDFPVDGTLAEQMAYCQSHQLRLHTRLGTFAVDSIGRPTSFAPDVLGSAAVTFGSGWHMRESGTEYSAYRWATSDARLAIDRSETAARGVVLDIELEPNPYQPESWVELEVLDGTRQVAHAMVSQRMYLRIPLDDERPSHEITLRMVDSSGGRESLPLFEARDQLCYRVFRVSLGSVPAHNLDIALWRRATNNNPMLTVQHTSAGVEIASDPGCYSYCAQYGPFESPADGSYEFLLEYVSIAGRLSFKVLDDERDCWLPSRPVEMSGRDVQMYELSVDLPRGTKFSLFVSNNRPAGGVSRFVLRRLAASVPPEQMMPKDPGVRRPARVPWAAASAEAVATAWRRLRSAVTSLEWRRAQRFQERITDESERVRDLEARVASLGLLSELEPLAQLLRARRPTPLHQNACGDFQLMARDHWLSLRGYPEFEMFSMSIDGLFEAVAHAAGVKEHVFAMPLCIYHLEHEKGSGWTPEGEAMLRKRISESGIIWLDSGSVHIWTMYMEWLRRPMIFNGSGWGLGDAQLLETTRQPVAGHRQ